MSAPLTIIIFADSADLLPLLAEYLSSERYVLQYFTDRSQFLARIETGKHEVDCLVFHGREKFLPVINYLHDLGVILPLVMIQRSTEPPISSLQVGSHTYIYQPSEVILTQTDMSEIGVAIDEAITKFLNLTPIVPTSDHLQSGEIKIPVSKPDLLLQQQRRLANKLKERLGYLAVYYKRNPRQFFRHLDRAQKHELLEQLKSQYRLIVLGYFTDSSQINDTIDEFVGLTFFSDLSVSEIVKIHMELMEEFAKQLKLEGRSEEILLDYRLTLIDIIAHLCEMYRRSVPREM